MRLPWWFQFRFHPVVGGGGACGAPRVGVPDPGRQVSPRSRGAWEAPVFRNPGPLWGVAARAGPAAPGGSAQPGASRWRVPPNAALTFSPARLEWLGGLRSWVLGSLSPALRPPPRGRLDRAVRNGTGWAGRVGVVPEVLLGIRRESGPRPRGLACSPGWWRRASGNEELGQLTLPRFQVGDAHDCVVLSLSPGLLCVGARARS